MPINNTIIFCHGRHVRPRFPRPFVEVHPLIVQMSRDVKATNDRFSSVVGNAQSNQLILANLTSREPPIQKLHLSNKALFPFLRFGATPPNIGTDSNLVFC